jgi:hypothetical protein
MKISNSLAYHVPECVGIGTAVRRTIVSNCSYPFGLAVSSLNYYWTDWDT